MDTTTNRELSLRWARTPMPKQLYPLRRFVVTGGQSLGYASLTGIKYASTPITSVPTAYSAGTIGTAIDGVGWGSDVFTGEKVLLMSVQFEDSLGNYAGGGMIDFDLPNNCHVLSIRQLTVPVDGGGSILVQEVYWL